MKDARLLKTNGETSAGVHPRARVLLRGVAIIAALMVLDRVSAVSNFDGLPITPWDPAIGLAFAFMVRHPRTAPAFVFIGIAGALTVGGAMSSAAFDWNAPIAAAAVATAGYSVAAFVVRRIGFHGSLRGVGDIVKLLAVAFPAVVAVSAGQAVIYAALGPLLMSDVMAATFRLAVGDIVGIAVVSPLALRAGAGEFARLAQRCASRPLETVGWLSLLSLAVWVVFGWEATDEFRAFYLLFLPVTAIALRGGLDGALVAIALTQLGMVSLVQLRGLPEPVVTQLQLLMLALSATGLLAGVVVSERERADARLKEHEERLSRVARLSASTAMVSAIAHDLSQPLTAARAFARAAVRRMEDDSADGAGATHELHAMVSQIDLAAAIIGRLRGFLRRADPQRSRAGMDELVTEACQFARGEVLRRGANLTVDAAAGLPVVNVDRVQIQQVVLNLLRNALDAVADQDAGIRRIAVVVRRAEIERAVEIAVLDSGSGVAPAIEPRLFEAFATSKRDGLGLGLAISRTIVEGHSGRLWLEGTGPSGTEFRFTIPVAENDL